MMKAFGPLRIHFWKPHLGYWGAAIVLTTKKRRAAIEIWGEKKPS